MKDQLLSKIHEHGAVVAVIGLGYVGLPLAVAFAEKGFPVVGIDVDGRKVAALKRGESWVQNMPSARLAGDRSQGLLDGVTLGLELKWGGKGLRLLPGMGRIEDVYLLRAIHEGLKRVSTPEALRQIDQPTN